MLSLMLPVRPSILPQISQSSKTKPFSSENSDRYATGRTVGLAERINDDTCLVNIDSLLSDISDFLQVKFHRPERNIMLLVNSFYCSSQ